MLPKVMAIVPFGLASAIGSLGSEYYFPLDGRSSLYGEVNTGMERLDVGLFVETFRWLIKSNPPLTDEEEKAAANIRLVELQSCALISPFFFAGGVECLRREAFLTDKPKCRTDVGDDCPPPNDDDSEKDDQPFGDLMLTLGGRFLSEEVEHLIRKRWDWKLVGPNTRQAIDRLTGRSDPLSSLAPTLLTKKSDLALQHQPAPLALQALIWPTDDVDGVRSIALQEALELLPADCSEVPRKEVVKLGEKFSVVFRRDPLIPKKLMNAQYLTLLDAFDQQKNEVYDWRSQFRQSDKPDHLENVEGTMLTRATSPLRRYETLNDKRIVMLNLIAEWLSQCRAETTDPVGRIPSRMNPVNEWAFTVPLALSETASSSTSAEFDELIGTPGVIEVYTRLIVRYTMAVVEGSSENIVVGAERALESIREWISAGARLNLLPDATRQLLADCQMLIAGYRQHVLRQPWHHILQTGLAGMRQPKCEFTKIVDSADGSRATPSFPPSADRAVRRNFQRQYIKLPRSTFYFPLTSVSRLPGNPNEMGRRRTLLAALRDSVVASRREFRYGRSLLARTQSQLLLCMKVSPFFTRGIKCLVAHGFIEDDFSYTVTAKLLEAVRYRCNDTERHLCELRRMLRSTEAYEALDRLQKLEVEDPLNLPAFLPADMQPLLDPNNVVGDINFLQGWIVPRENPWQTYRDLNITDMPLDVTGGDFAENPPANFEELASRVKVVADVGHTPVTKLMRPQWLNVAQHAAAYRREKFLWIHAVPSDAGETIEQAIVYMGETLTKRDTVTPLERSLMLRLIAEGIRHLGTQRKLDKIHEMVNQVLVAFPSTQKYAFATKANLIDPTTLRFIPTVSHFFMIAGLGLFGSIQGPPRPPGIIHTHTDRSKPPPPPPPGPPRFPPPSPFLMSEDDFRDFISVPSNVADYVRTVTLYTHAVINGRPQYYFDVIGGALVSVNEWLTTANLAGVLKDDELMLLSDCQLLLAAHIQDKLQADWQTIFRNAIGLGDPYVPPTEASPSAESASETSLQPSVESKEEEPAPESTPSHTPALPGQDCSAAASTLPQHELQVPGGTAWLWEQLKGYEEHSNFGWHKFRPQGNSDFTLEEVLSYRVRRMRDIEVSDMDRTELIELAAHYYLNLLVTGKSSKVQEFPTFAAWAFPSFSQNYGEAMHSLSLSKAEMHRLLAGGAMEAYMRCAAHFAANLLKAPAARDGASAEILIRSLNDAREIAMEMNNKHLDNFFRRLALIVLSQMWQHAASHFVKDAASADGVLRWSSLAAVDCTDDQWTVLDKWTKQTASETNFIEELETFRMADDYDASYNEIIQREFQQIARNNSLRPSIQERIHLMNLTSAFWFVLKIEEMTPLLHMRPSFAAFAFPSFWEQFDSRHEKFAVDVDEMRIIANDPDSFEAYRKVISIYVHNVITGKPRSDLIVTFRALRSLSDWKESTTSPEQIRFCEEMTKLLYAFLMHHYDQEMFVGRSHVASVNSCSGRAGTEVDRGKRTITRISKLNTMGNRNEA